MGTGEESALRLSGAGHSRHRDPPMLRPTGCSKPGACKHQQAEAIATRMGEQEEQEQEMESSGLDDGAKASDECGRSSTPRQPHCQALGTHSQQRGPCHQELTTTDRAVLPRGGTKGL